MSSFSPSCVRRNSGLALPYEIVVGLRYLRAKRRNRTISLNTVVSVTGITLGVAAPRLQAEGYGPLQPVCPANDTLECKLKNRRIAAQVTAK